MRQFGKIVILGTLSAFQLTQKPWSLGLTSTDRNHVLGKTSWLKVYPENMENMVISKYKHWWTQQKQEPQDGDLPLCYLSVLWAN